MDRIPFPVIDLVATGSNIQRLRQERGLTVRDLQRYFGFEEPRAIYKWQKGETLPTVDNLYALGILLEVPIEGILVPQRRHNASEQQAEACCSGFLACFRRGTKDGTGRLLFMRRLQVRLVTECFLQTHSMYLACRYSILFLLYAHGGRLSLNL